MQKMSSPLQRTHKDVFGLVYSFIDPRDVKTHARFSVVSKDMARFLNQDAIIRHHMSAAFPKEYSEMEEDEVPKGEWKYAYKITATISSFDKRAATLMRKQELQIYWDNKYIDYRDTLDKFFSAGIWGTAGVSACLFTLFSAKIGR